MIRMINRTGKFMKQLKSNELEMLEAMGQFLKTKLDYHVPKDTLYLMSRNAYVIARNELFLHNDCHYAKYQEFGTYKMKAQPFFKPTARNYTRDLKIIAEIYLKRGL